MRDGHALSEPLSTALVRVAARVVASSEWHGDERVDGRLFRRTGALDAAGILAAAAALETPRRRSEAQPDPGEIVPASARIPPAEGAPSKRGPGVDALVCRKPQWLGLRFVAAGTSAAAVPPGRYPTCPTGDGEVAVEDGDVCVVKLRGEEASRLYAVVGERFDAVSTGIFAGVDAAVWTPRPFTLGAVVGTVVVGSLHLGDDEVHLTTLDYFEGTTWQDCRARIRTRLAEEVVRTELPAFQGLPLVVDLDGFDARFVALAVDQRTKSLLDRCFGEGWAASRVLRVLQEAAT